MRYIFFVHAYFGHIFACVAHLKVVHVERKCENRYFDLFKFELILIF